MKEKIKNKKKRKKKEDFKKLKKSTLHITIGDIK